MIICSIGSAAEKDCAMCIISTKSELSDLAKASGFEIVETFYSDGENRELEIISGLEKTINIIILDQPV